MFEHRSNDISRSSKHVESETSVVAAAVAACEFSKLVVVWKNKYRVTVVREKRKKLDTKIMSFQCARRKSISLERPRNRLGVVDDKPIE